LPACNRSARQNPFLDVVDLGADLVGHPVHGVSDLVDDLFQQCRDGLHPMPALQDAAGRIDSAKRLVAAADQQTFGHRKAKKSGFLGRGVDVANEIGKYPVDAVIGGVKLLIIVFRQQQLARQRREIQVGNP
jgi:hypothetical protein